MFRAKKVPSINAIINASPNLGKLHKKGRQEEDVSKFKLGWPHSSQLTMAARPRELSWRPGSGSDARRNRESMTESLLRRIVEQGACLHWGKRPRSSSGGRRSLGGTLHVYAVVVIAG